MNDAAIHAIFRAKQQQHHELYRPLNWPALRRICRREGVRLLVRRHPETAQLVRFGHTWSIIVNADVPSHHTYLAAHELAHLWLHVDAADGREAVVFNFDDYSKPDPRESEAEYLCTLMMQGPPFHRHF